MSAPYNPREIDAYARKNLEKDLKRFGCVEPLVWNESTGNLVSGHQRLSILDQLEGSQEYHVGVSVIKVSEKRERELNVVMNNAQAQGKFTADGLFGMIRDGLDLNEVALTRMDLEYDFGTLPDDLFAPIAGNATEVADVINGLVPPKPKMNKNKLRKDAALKPENDADYYLMVCFESRTEKERWLSARKLDPDARFISYPELQAVGV